VGGGLLDIRFPVPFLHEKTFNQEAGRVWFVLVHRPGEMPEIVSNTNGYSNESAFPAF
jgi:hypothetical protein